LHQLPRLLVANGEIGQMKGAQGKHTDVSQSEAVLRIVDACTRLIASWPPSALHFREKNSGA
jgi:hypothetical protein